MLMQFICQISPHYNIWIDKQPIKVYLQMSLKQGAIK